MTLLKRNISKIEGAAGLRFTNYRPDALQNERLRS
jgi:hypothetical protein